MKYIVIMSLLLFASLVGPTMAVAAEEAMVIEDNDRYDIEYSWKEEAIALVPLVNHMEQCLVDYSVQVFAHYQNETDQGNFCETKEIYTIPNKCNVGDEVPEQYRTITITHDGEPYSIAINMCFLPHKNPWEVIYILRHVIADQYSSKGYTSYEIVTNEPK